MPTRADYAKIHIALKELSIDDEMYRDILWHRFKKESSKELTDTQVRVLLGVFQKAGWSPRPKGLPSKKKNPSSTPPRDPQSRKIRAMWITMGHAGTINNPSEMALNKYVKRMTGLDALRFCHHGFKSDLIENLKGWQRRDCIKTAGWLLFYLDMQPVIGGAVLWKAKETT